MLRVALPSRGRLAEPAYLLVKAAGYTWHRDPRELNVQLPEQNLHLTYVHPKDAAMLVASGYIDIAISARDILAEHSADVIELMPLGFASCRIVLAVKNSSSISHPTELAGETLATSYPNLSAIWFAEHQIPVKLIELHGAVEMAPWVGLSGGIVDSYQTGWSFKVNGLKVVETLMESQAILIGSSSNQNPLVTTFLEKISTALATQNDVVLEK